MKLNNKNVKELLNDQVQIYLHGPLTYGTLRSNCLTVAPVQPIINPVLSMLEAIAIDDMNQATTTLTRQAHDRQLDQDENERKNDKDNATTYQQEKQQLESKESSLNWDLFRVNALYIAHQLSHSQAHSAWQEAQFRINRLEQNIHHHGGHVHAHPSHSEFHVFNSQLEHERRLLSTLLDNERREYFIYLEHEKNKNRLEREISNCKSSINSLTKQQNDLKTRETARNQRRDARAKSPYELTRNALSSSNANQLDSDIQREHNAITMTCNNMKQLATDSCYPVFFELLDSYVDDLNNLSQPEKTALKQIITKMKEYHHDVDSRQQHESGLFKLKATLQSCKQNHANKDAEYTRLHNRNKDLVNANEQLGSTKLALQSSHEYLLEQRDNFSQYTLAAAGITGAGSITAYFLVHAGVIATVPGVLAAVVGVAIMGLIITSSVFAILAALKESELTTCEQTMVNNIEEMEQNNQTMTQSQKIDLPTLANNIRILQTQVDDQTMVTNAARQKETLSLEDAKRIKVYAPEAGNAYGAFFPSASAPSAEVVKAEIYSQEYK